MPEFNTYDFDWIEVVPPSSVALRQKIRNILHTSENCSANVTDLNLTTGEFQIILHGKLKKRQPMQH